MKKLILLFIIFSGFVFAQPKINVPAPPAPSDFQFNGENYMNNFIVVGFPNKKKELLFEKAKNWIKSTYVNSSESIQSEISNEMLRFQGISSKSISPDSFYSDSDLYYSVQLNFKDEKIKVEILNLKMISAYKRNKYSINLPVKKVIREGDELTLNYTEVPNVLNNLMRELKNYLNGIEKDW